MAMPNPYLQIFSCPPESENREQEIGIGYTETRTLLHLCRERPQ